MTEPKVSVVIAAKNLAGRVFDQSKAQVKSWASSVGSALNSVKGLLASVGVALSGAAVISVLRRAGEEAIDAEAANNRMAQSVQNLGLQYDAVKPKIDATVDRLSKLAGKDDEDVSDALSNLITKTGDLTGSLEQLPLVLNRAAKEKESLAAASDFVAKAMNGQLKALKALGITTKDHDLAMKQLAARYAGFAAKDAQGLGGALTRIQLGWNNLLEVVGTVMGQHEGFRGVLKGIEDRLESAQNWVARNSEELGVLARAIATAAQWTLQFLALIVRATASIVGWLARQHDLIKAVVAGTAALVALAAVAPGLALALRIVTTGVGLLRGALLLLAANPVTIALAAVAAAVGLIAWKAGEAERAIDSLRQSMEGLSDGQLIDRWAKAQENVAKAQADVDAAASKRRVFVGIDEERGEQDPVTARTDAALAKAKQELAATEQEIARRGKDRIATRPTPATGGGPIGGGEEVDEKAAQKAWDNQLELLKRQAQADSSRAQALAQLRMLELQYIEALKLEGLTVEEELRLRNELGEVQQALASADQEELARLRERAGADQTRIQAMAELSRWERQLQESLRSGTLTVAEAARARKQLLEVQEAQAKVQEDELDLLGRSVSAKQVTADVVTRLYTVQRQLVDAIAAENAAIAAGMGSLRQKVELEERLAKANQVLGRPPKVGEGTGRAPSGADVGGVPAEKRTVDQGFRATVGAAMMDFGETTKGIDSIGQALAAVTAGSLAEFQDAWISTFESIADGSKTVVGGLVGMAGQFVASIARGLAKLYFAKGVGAIGEGLLGMGPGFAAAGQYFAAAALFGALAGATGGGATGSSRGAGGSSGGGLGSSGVGDGAKGTLTIIWPAGSQLYDMTDPKQEAALAAALSDITDRKVVIDRR